MPSKPSTKKIRGTPIVLPPWWLRAVERHTVGASLSELAADLSKLAKRETPWDRTTVGKFLKNEFPTLEMMEAFCRKFELPPPHFVARSYEEAAHLLRESRKFDDVPANPDRQRRLAALDRELEHLEADAQDQTERVGLSNGEGSSARRRPRGVVRGRPSSS